MTSVKVTEIGDSLGIELPKEIMEHLQASEGDTLLLTETPNGFTIQPYDEDVAE